MTDQSNLTPTTDQQRILQAVKQCFEVSPTCPGIGDVAAIILQTVADIVTPSRFTYDSGAFSESALQFESGQEARNREIRYRLLELAEELNGTDYGDQL